MTFEEAVQVLKDAQAGKCSLLWGGGTQRAVIVVLLELVRRSETNTLLDEDSHTLNMFRPIR